ncbi:hypothetical protein [Parapedobacter sp.]
MYHHVTSNPLSSLRFFVVCAVLLLGAVKAGYGQRVYADAQLKGNTSSGLTNSGTIGSPTLSVNPPYTDFTTLTAKSTLGTATAWQQLIFPTTLTANSIVYLKLTTETALLGGEISVQTYANSTSTSTGSLVTPQSTSFTSVDGMTYVAVTSQSAFNAVRLTLSSPLALGTNTANIYYAFFETTPTGCSEAIGTSVGGSGISLGGNVSDPLDAIDNNFTTFSTISGGLLSVDGTISQSAHFASQSEIGSAATVTFSVPANILSLGLFNDVTINTYNGFNPTPVSSTPLSSLLSLDLLGLLSSGDEYTVSVVPSSQFDRIEVSVATGIGLLNNFQLHEIQRTPAPPKIPEQTSPYVIELCDGENAIIAIESSSVGGIFHWYDQNDAPLNNIENTENPKEYRYLYSNPGEYKVYITATWSGECIAESEKTEVTLIVHPKPPTPEIVTQ